MSRVLLLFVLLIPSLTQAAQAPCQYYASPRGGGTGLTPASPMTIQAWLRQARGGQTLCLLDGRYTGSESMLNDSEAVRHGTASQRLTIRALRDGAVTIDGGGSRAPLGLYGSWYVVTGLNVHHGNNAVIALQGTHNLVQRVAAWDITDRQSAVVALGGTYNTLEDAIVFGEARKAIAAGTSELSCSHNTLRRVFARFESKSEAGGTGPTETVELGYGQKCVTAENVVAIRDVQGKGHVTEPEAPLKAFRCSHCKLLGSIAFQSTGSRMDAPRLIHTYPDGGSNAQKGDAQPMTGSLFQDLVAVVERTHARFSSLAPFAFDGGAGSGNTVRNVVGIAGQPGRCGGSGVSCQQVRSGESLQAVLGGQSVWQAVPGVCRRYVNGTLTTEGLWPWPMEQRLDDAMRQAGKAPVRLTATLERLLGPIPAQCRGSASIATPDTAALPAPRNLRVLSAQ